MAVGAIRAATAAGLRVPDDLSVVGFDDMSMAPHMRPSLTTIRQDKARLGREAAAALLRQIERSPEQPEPALQPEPQPPTVTLPVELVVRGSTAPVDGIES
jgi:DNA-binding LacI/PurR family transcriptional regulator